MLEYRTPLEQTSPAGGVKIIDRPDLQVLPVVDRGLLLVQEHASGAALDEAIFRTLEVRLPTAGHTTQRLDRTVLWLAPREWIIELPRREADSVRSALLSHSAQGLIPITDVSESYACFEVGGSRAPEALMSGCSLDLKPESFAAGQVARTAYADMPVILWRPGDGPQIRCWVDRSFAQVFWRSLTESATAW